MRIFPNLPRNVDEIPNSKGPGPRTKKGCDGPDTSDTELHGISLQPHDTTQVLPLISRIMLYICHCTTGITQFLIYTSDTELHGISLQPHDTTQVLPLISRIMLYICHCTTGITQFLIYTSDTELHGISLQPHDTTQVLPLISRIYVIVLQVLLSS